ncbi:MAG: GNAT family N-acetyltransferase [Sphingomonadaceae bacterium]
MAQIIPLDAIDPLLVEQLLDEAFGPEREARTAYRIRTGMEWLPALSFAALDDDDFLAGSIQIWPVSLTDAQGRAHPLLMVGPVAVAPARQNQGYGKALMTASLEAIENIARSAPPALPQIMIGDAEYYGQWGFSADHTAGWRCPGPWENDRLLVRHAFPALLPQDGMLGPWLAHTPPLTAK